MTDRAIQGLYPPWARLLKLSRASAALESGAIQPPQWKAEVAWAFYWISTWALTAAGRKSANGPYRH